MIVTLYIYRAPRGRWSGKLYLGANELRVSGTFASPQEVEDTAKAIGFHPHHVEIAKI